MNENRNYQPSGIKMHNPYLVIFYFVGLPVLIALMMIYIIAG